MMTERASRGWIAILVAESIALWAWNLPTWLDFRAFAFGDLGASLTTQDLVERGYRPAVDFAHHYGLLPIAVGRVWFGIWGRSPMTLYALMAMNAAGMAWCLGQAARVRKVGTSGMALLAIGLPYFVQSCYPNLAHALEAGLLCRALYEQARGRLGVALAMATLAVLAKPNLGLVLGFALVVLILSTIPGRWTWGKVFGRDALGPALGVGMVAILGLIAIYGPIPVFRSIVPTTGLATYRAGNFGFFFGVGRDFWWPVGKGPGYYLGTVVGFWIAGSLVLWVAAIRAGLRRFRGPSDGLVATCGFVHAVFVFGMFGHRDTWVYDSYVLGLGLALLPWSGTWVLVAIAGLGLKTGLPEPWTVWRTHARSTVTAGLWDVPLDRDEWANVRSIMAGRTSAVLATSGAVEVLVSGFEPAESVFLVPGMERELDIARKAMRLRGASVIVVPKYLGNERLVTWPEFARALEGTRVGFDGTHYRVYLRE